MPKSNHTNSKKTVSYSNTNELKQRVEKLDTHTITMKNGRAFNGADSYFEWSKAKLKLISKNDEFLTLFSPEIDRMLGTLEEIRKIYASNDQKLANHLAYNLELDVSNTLQGIERVQNEYHNNRDIHDFIELTESIEKEIQSLQETEKKLLEQIESIDIVHEDIIKTFVKDKYEKEDLDIFYEVVNEHYGMDLGQEHAKYIKKQLLQEKYKNVQQEISELKMAFPCLKSFAQANDNAEQEKHHKSMSFKF